jgi:hypothetical protein
LTYRLLDDLLHRLPSESALRTEMRDDMDPAEVAEIARGASRQRSGGPWSRTEYLLAEALDRLGDIAYRVVRVHSNKVKAIPPYPRPGVMTKYDHAETAEARAGAAQHRADIERERAEHARARERIRRERAAQRQHTEAT